MLHVKFGQYARTLSAPSLRAIRASEGVAGLVGAVAGMVDDASAFLRDNQNEFTLTTSILEDTTDAREKISILLVQGVAGREAAEIELGALRTPCQHPSGLLRLYVDLPVNVNVARGLQLVRAAAIMAAWQHASCSGFLYAS